MTIYVVILASMALNLLYFGLMKLYLRDMYHKLKSQARTVEHQDVLPDTHYEAIRKVKLELAKTGELGSLEGRREEVSLKQVLQEIPEVGAGRLPKLLGRFDTIKEIQMAGMDGLSNIPSIGHTTARRILDSLGEQTQPLYYEANELPLSSQSSQALSDCITKYPYYTSKFGK